MSEEVSRIFRTINQLCHQAEWKQIDTMLTGCNVENEPIEVSLAYLTISNPARTHLLQYQPLYDRFKERLLTDETRFSDVDALLWGL